jgi:hypothetical protein
MDHLIEIVQFLSKNKFKHLEVFAKGSRLEQFYEKIRDGSLQNEQQARDYFFPNNKNAKAYYYRLAAQLEERLLSLLFLVDFNQSSASAIQLDALLVFRNYAAVASLLVRFMRVSAIKIAEETIKLSLRHEFTDANLLLARHLVMHYGNSNPNKQKHQYYSKILARQQELLRLELLAEKYLTDIKVNFMDKAFLNPSYLKLLIQYAEELRAYMPHYSSYRFNLLTYTLLIERYEYSADYDQTIAVCNEALAFFKKRKQDSSRAMIVLITERLMRALMMLERYPEVERIGQDASQATAYQNVNWFVIKASLFINYTQARQYARALVILLEVQANPHLSKQTLLVQERWKAYAALLHYLIRLGKVSAPADYSYKFRAQKFLNEFRGATQAKAGINVLLITIVILFLLLDKKYDAIIDRVDALKAYTHRHLRQEVSIRSNCFIKLLLQLEKGNFHPVAVQRKAEPYYKKLLAVPQNQTGQDIELEIIPYETLWEYIIESLSLPDPTKVRGSGEK